MADEPPLAEQAEMDALGEPARSVLDYRVAVEAGATVLAVERAGEEDLLRLEECTARMAVRPPSTSTGAPTCTSTSAWPRRRTRRGW